jgi:hypothetical protein
MPLYTDKLNERMLWRRIELGVHSRDNELCMHVHGNELFSGTGSS